MDCISRMIKILNLLEFGDQKTICSLTILMLCFFFSVCKECFDFIDHDKNGVIDKAELITVMRGIGLNPSEKDAEELIASVAETGEIQKFSDVKGTGWSRPFLVSIRLRKTKSLIFIKLHCV